MPPFACPGCPAGGPELRELAPVAWQETADGRRLPVAVEYAVAPDGTVRFALPAGHWLAVTGLSREWDWGASWQWVRVYNPFDNGPEYYWWHDFLREWPGEAWNDRLMVVVYQTHNRMDRVDTP